MCAQEEQRRLRLLRVSEPVSASEYERVTGVSWSSSFADVNDDGNCLMAAVWKGLHALLQHYPHLKQVMRCVCLSVVSDLLFVFVIDVVLILCVVVCECVCV